MENKTIEELRNELKELCEKTETSYKGTQLLLKYYMNQLGWSEAQSIKYILGLYDDGTIEKIKMLGKGGEEI